MSHQFLHYLAIAENVELSLSNKSKKEENRRQFKSTKIAILGRNEFAKKCNRVWLDSVIGRC